MKKLPSLFVCFIGTTLAVALYLWLANPAGFNAWMWFCPPVIGAGAVAIIWWLRRRALRDEVEEEQILVGTAKLVESENNSWWRYEIVVPKSGTQITTQRLAYPLHYVNTAKDSMASVWTRAHLRHSIEVHPTDTGGIHEKYWTRLTIR